MSKKTLSLLVSMALILMFLITCRSQKPALTWEQLSAPNAIAANRRLFKQELIEKKIQPVLSQPVLAANENEWLSAFWGMELIQFRSPESRQAIENAFTDLNSRSPEFQRGLLELIYTLYPRDFLSQVKQFASTTPMPKLFAMAVLYLGQANPESFKPESYLSLLTRKFPDWPLNPILVELDRELQSFRKLSFEKRPSLISLLRHPFEAGKTIIYSLQRQNRDYSGLVVIKSPTGLFLRTRDGTIFQIPQLARSASNLPGYLTNGNTPQGIFSIQGIDTSASLFIGQTPNLQLVLPGEASITKYFHAGTITDTVWTREKYASLLPTEWRDYLPIYQAYNAGLAGRTEIIAHGTTIDPEYYRGQAFYPNTPSLGCLTTLEIWSPVDGHCLFSNQWALTQAFNSTGNAAGYLVVVEIDAQPRPVCLEEVRVVLLQAEGSLPLPDEICE